MSSRDKTSPLSVFSWATASVSSAKWWALRQEVRHLCAFRLPDRDLTLLADAAEAYVHTVLERGFRTLDFYKSLS